MPQVLKQQRKVAINPTRSCAPIGAIVGTLGVHAGMAIVHGSQGCATYPRHQLARHFREPIEVATTSLTERTTVYGGRENLIAALRNVYLRCHPSMMVVISTCLSETIGDDVPAIIQEFRDEMPEAELPILSVSAPSYIGTHITGMDNFLSELVKHVPEQAEQHGRLNLIPGWVNPGDLRELKAMMRKMGVDPLLLTDYSDPLDGGLYLPKPRHPKGGTPLEDIKACSGSCGTVAIQRFAGFKAAELLEKRYGVKAKLTPMPIGVENTDVFLEAVSELTGAEPSEELMDERARLLDAIVDAHMFLTGLKVAIFGDPDLVYALTRFCHELGMEVSYALTSYDSSAWGEDMLALVKELGADTEVIYKGDLHELHKRIREEPVDLLFGTSKGKFISRAEKIPLVRVGFPVEDRFGYHRRAILGYRGSISLVDEVVNAYLVNGGEQRREVVSNTLLERYGENGS